MANAQINRTRCAWTAENPLNNEYHDNEWGVPLHDDQKLFEFLISDAFQAGLSFKKRENFRKAFDNFDAEKTAAYQEDKIQELLNDEGIIRNKLNRACPKTESFLSKAPKRAISNSPVRAAERSRSKAQGRKSACYKSPEWA